jgi:flavin reductase (DIM6/NTAB) family NADH-FMN oxidoreductase RutF
MNFDVDELGLAASFKLVSSVVVPRPIAWVVSQSAQGHLNAAPFSFFNVVCSDPLLIALGVGPRDGKLKDTSRNILETGQFVVNAVSRGLAEQMNHTSLAYEAGINELHHAGLDTAPSMKVAPPRIAQSPAALECETWKVIEAAPGRVVILARVVAVYLDDAAMLDPERYYVNTPALELLGRMHGAGWYAHTSDLFQMTPPVAANEVTIVPGGGH